MNETGDCLTDGVAASEVFMPEKCLYVDFQSTFQAEIPATSTPISTDPCNSHTRLLRMSGISIRAYRQLR